MTMVMGRGYGDMMSCCEFEVVVETLSCHMWRNELLSLAT